MVGFDRNQWSACVGIRSSRDKERLPFVDIVSSARPTFLLGELGSGKSTVAGLFVLESLKSNQGDLAFIVPAQYLRGRSVQTVLEFASVVSDYVNDELAEVEGGFSLTNALKEGLQTTIVLDGVDELSSSAASKILARAEDLNGRYASVRLIATGRPIELRGLDYSRWQIAEVPPLSVHEQRALLRNEAIAEGLAEDGADQDAERRLERLRAHPELASVAGTPLFVRMLRPHLGMNEQHRTLGDLLYDVLLERLGGWEQKEGRLAVAEDFQRRYPDALAREGLAAAIGAAIVRDKHGGISRERLRAILKALIGDEGDHEALAAQASEYMLKNLLVEEGGLVQFPSQPLLECAVGLHLVRSTSGGRPSADSLDFSGARIGETWRSYSFAAAIARRKGILAGLRPSLYALTDGLFSEEGAMATPAVATIVAEAQDEALAGHFVEGLTLLPYRPLRLIAGAEATAGAALARSLALAGDVGFDWLFTEYLDPAYPLDGADDRLLRAILPAWAAAVRFTVTPSQAEQLKSLVAPHLAARSFQCHTLLPTVALLAPEAFETPLLARLYVDALSRAQLEGLATERLNTLADGPERPHVLAALRSAIAGGAGGTSPRAVALLLSFEDGPVADPVLARAIIATPSKDSNDWIDHIGTDGPDAFLRWRTLLRDQDSASAAVQLYRKGERRLGLLGPALLNGLHDGGRVRGAESVLDELLAESGGAGVKWLARCLEETDRYHGAHSGQWRLLLKHLLRKEEDRPRANEVLVGAARHIGEMILPRYPEVRRMLCELLESEGEAREALERSLWSFSRPIRTGAARVLLSCFPESAARAAELVVHGAGTSMGTGEWYQFCFQLDLGEAVLNHLETSLNSFSTVPRAFALLLMDQNGRVLDVEQRRTVIRALFGDGFHLKSASGSGGTSTFFQSEATFPVLLEALSGIDEGLHQGAAQALLDYHRERLSIDEFATCWALLYDELSTWTVRRFDSDLGPLAVDPKFRDALGRISERLQAAGRPVPLAWQYISALDDPDRWADLLWRAVARDRTASDLEYLGVWFMGIGRKQPNVGRVLGQAARSYLDDPRFDRAESDYFAAQITQWLSVLADEFGPEKLSDSELEAALSRSAKDETVVALLARLGRPSNTHVPRNDRSYLLTFQQPPPERLSLDLLGRALRDGDGPHPQLSPLVETALLEGNLLDLESIANATVAGSLLATVLAFCKAEDVPADWPVRVMVAEGTRSVGRSTVPQVSVAFHRAVGLMLASADWRNKYVEALEAALAANPGAPWSGVRASLYDELLHAGRPLDDDMFSGIVDELGARPYLLSRTLAESLVTSFAADPPPAEMTEPLLRLAEDLSAGARPDQEYATGPLQLIVSLAMMRLQGHTHHTATDLFLRGLTEVLVDFRTTHHAVAADFESRLTARHVLGLIEPLLQRVPGSHLHECIRQGRESRDPVIRSCCAILSALAGSTSALSDC